MSSEFRGSSFFSPAKFIVLFATLSCGAGMVSGGNPMLPDNAPDWVVRGGGAFNDGDRSFYGVGAVTGVRNIGLARDAAANRARSDLATSIDVFIRALYKDYQAAISDLNADASAEEQLIEQAIKSYTEATLSGTRIVEYWADDRGGTLYAVAELDFESAEQQFNKLSQLNQQAREYIRRNAERMFDELESENRRRP